MATTTISSTSCQRPVTLDEYETILDLSQLHPVVNRGEAYYEGRQIAIEPGVHCKARLFDQELPDKRWGSLLFSSGLLSTRRDSENQFFNISVTQSKFVGGEQSDAQHNAGMLRRSEESIRLPIKKPAQQYPIFTVTIRLSAPWNEQKFELGVTPGKHFLFNSLNNSRPFVDTKFFVFSRRDGDRVVQPKVLLANRQLLMKANIDYFSVLLGDSTFRESQATPLNAAFPEGEETSLPSNGELSDSDMESEEDLEESNLEHEPDEDIYAPPDPSGGGVLGRTIIMKDGAYSTWKALIWYIYTKEIDFAPPKRDGMNNDTRKKFIAEFTKKNPLRPPPCSAKSMYRLADKIGSADLQKLAFEHINKNLSKATIIEEAFSRFPSLYPRIWDIEMRYLKDCYNELDKDVLTLHVKGVMDSDPEQAIKIVGFLFGHLRT